MANKILKKFSKDELPNLTFNDLKDYSGLGPAKACEIVACFELRKRLLKDKKAEIYLKPEEIWEELKELRDHREVFDPAVRHLAVQIILTHNHPSGDSKPSEDDLEITERLVESGKILGIEIIDRIIITKTGFTSFKKKI